MQPTDEQSPSGGDFGDWQVTEMHVSEGRRQDDGVPTARPPTSPDWWRVVQVVTIGMCVVLVSVCAYLWWDSIQVAHQGAPAPGTSGEANTAPASVSTQDDSSAAGPVTTTLEPATDPNVLRSELQAYDPRQLNFIPGTDELSAEGQAAVKELAVKVIAHPLVPIVVGATTFTRTSPEQEFGLSTRQAGAIVEALEAEGVSPDRLGFAGHGNAQREWQEGETLLLFQADDPVLAAQLAEINTTAVALTPDQTLTPRVAANLDLVAERLVAGDSSSVTLVAHAYLGSSNASHDLAHVVLDEAVVHLDNLGIDPARISTVGKGQAPIEADLPPMITFDVGPAAAMPAALAQIDTEQIRFEPGTDELTAESLELLGEVTSALLLDPDAQVQLLAHSYTGATSEQNHDLSHDLGTAVVEVLVGAGIADGRLAVIGNGDLQDFAEPGRESYLVFRVVG